MIKTSGMHHRTQLSGEETKVLFHNSGQSSVEVYSQGTNSPNF